MRNQLLTTALTISVLSFISLATNKPAQALVFACETATKAQIPSLIANGSGANLIGRVTPTSGCQISTETQDFLNLPQGPTVNNEQFFGFSDWIFDGKIGVSGYGSGSGTGTGTEKTWNIVDEAAANASNMLLIFKSGNNPLVGYLVSNGADSGTWNNPFTGDVFDFPGNSQEQGVSHLSIYYRGTTQVVPTPAAVLPGLMGMGAAVFRKKKQAGEASQEA